MKRFIFAVLPLFLISFICLTAFVSNNDFEIKVNDGYSYCYKNTDMSEVAERLDMSEDALKDFFGENNVVFLAVNKDKTSQIRITERKTAFSRATGDIKNLDKSGLKTLAKEISKDNKSGYSVCEADARRYIKISETLKDSGGVYTATQFITVADGKLINLTFYNNGEYMPSESYKTFNSFKINDQMAPSKKPVIYIFLIAFAIAAFVAVIIVMILGIIKDKKKKDK